MENKDVKGVNKRELIKQRNEEIINQGSYIRIEMVISPSDESTFTTVKIENVDSETMGKTILALKHTMFSILERADDEVFEYLKKYDVVSKEITNLDETDIEGEENGLG